MRGDGGGGWAVEGGLGVVGLADCFEEVGVAGVVALSTGLGLLGAGGVCVVGLFGVLEVGGAVGMLDFGFFELCASISAILREGFLTLFPISDSGETRGDEGVASVG